MSKLVKGTDRNASFFKLLPLTANIIVLTFIAISLFVYVSILDFQQQFWGTYLELLSEYVDF